MAEQARLGHAIYLAPRERCVVTHIAQGETDKEIALTLHVTVSTVSAYIESIRAKVGPLSRVQLALWAIRDGYAAL